MPSRGWQNNWNASRGGRHQYRNDSRPHHYGNFNSSQRDPREVEWQQNNTANPSARRPYQGNPQQVQYQASDHHPEQNYYSNRQTNNNFSRGGEWQLNNAANPSARRPYQGDPQQAEYQASHHRSEQNHHSNRQTNNNYYRGEESQLNNAANSATRRHNQGDPQLKQYPASYASSGGDAPPLVSATTSSSGQANHLPLQQRIPNIENLTFEEKLREQLSGVINSDFFRLESLPLLRPEEIDRKEARNAATKAINEVMARQENMRQEVMQGHEEEHEEETIEEVKGDKSDEDEDEEETIEEAKGDKSDEDEDESMNESDEFDDKERSLFKKPKTNDPDDVSTAATNLIDEKKTTNDPGYDFTREEIESFYDNLPMNFVFEMGFRVKGINPNDEENCWCPCGDQMLPWRLRFDLDYLVKKYKFTSCGNGRFTPNGLMDHLEAKKKSCLLHYGVDVFLRKVYGDLRGTGHKAMFKPGDLNFKVAEAAEKKEKEKLYEEALRKLKEEERKNNDLKDQIRQKENQLKDCMEKMKEVNPDRSKAVDHLIDNFKTLGFDKHAAMTDNKIQDLVEKEEAFIDLMNTLDFISLGGPQLNYNEKITITIRQDVNQATFDINKVMDDEYKEWKKKENGRNIFETKRKHTWKFVNNWIVNFAALNDKDRKKAIKEESTAIDDGGPTRQFLSQLWGQIDLLAVPHDNKKRKTHHEIKLFRQFSGGICPEMNLNLEDKVKEATDGEGVDTIAALNERINRYYNVIGMMLFCSIVGKHSISSKVMGRFMRNVLLRNCEPCHKDKYPAAQVLKDCQEIGGNFVVDELLNRKIRDLSTDYCFEIQDEVVLEQEVCKENFVDLFIQMAFVESRRRAIDFIKQGISLYGKVDVAHMVFSKTPIDVISKRLFAKDLMSTDDVIKRLRIRNEEIHYDDGTSFPVERESHQDVFFEGPFLDTIRELSGDQLSSFFEFCTGYNYIPQNTEFLIEVEFSLNGDEDLPVSHTCVQHLRLPRKAYNGDKIVFKKKLLQSLSNGLRLTMQ